MSHAAIATGQHNHQLNGNTTGAAFLAHDIFSSWGKLTRSGPYGLVIVDPPSYQKGSFVATKDYGRLMRRLPDLIAPGGHALLCLNAPELGADFLRSHMQELAPDMTYVARIANPVAFADADEDRALKRGGWPRFRLVVLTVLPPRSGGRLSIYPRRRASRRPVCGARQVAATSPWAKCDAIA
jgi:23S rRNA G2069 N7-methylase RlmK/C1962 C5-methylase RlmI